MQKKRVLIIQEKLPHYRLPFFNLLAQQPEIELTLAAAESLPSDIKVNFNLEKLEIKTWRGFTRIIDENLIEKCSRFDVVIAMFNIRWLSILRLLMLRKRHFKLILWGIGVSSDGPNGFDGDRRFDRLRFWAARRADGLIFYSEYPIKKYAAAGIPLEKMTVAHNTIAIEQRPLDESTLRDRFLFIGTFHKQKGLVELLEAWKIAYLKNPNLPELDLIGDGPELSAIEKWVAENGFSQKIHLHGLINEETKLIPFFNRAIASISPRQAGLSVLSSLARGVPFISHKNAITGGERFNIIQNETGFLYETEEELSDLLLFLDKNRAEATRLSQSAHSYFNQNRRIEQMVNDYKKAIIGQ